MGETTNYSLKRMAQRRLWDFSKLPLWDFGQRQLWNFSQYWLWDFGKYQLWDLKSRRYYRIRLSASGFKATWCIFSHSNMFAETDLQSKWIKKQQLKFASGSNEKSWFLHCFSYYLNQQYIATKNLFVKVWTGSMQTSIQKANIVLVTMSINQSIKKCIG